jgi:hypothetical protein
MKNAAPESTAAVMPAGDYGTYGAEYRFSAADDVRDPELHLVLACWQDMRRGRAMPTRDELNPRSLGAALRNVQMFEVIDGGDDFRCRVFGTGIAETTGLQITGRCLSEFEDTRLRTRMTAALRRVVQTRAPVRMFAERAAVGHLAHKRVETIWLPLGSGESVTHVLSGCVFPNRGP